ncbi:hypothetical protein [Methanobrevibacter sp. DSM 116169]|uniref:hypothetical protein n=1 Tax=Methanobrevibacter sp. DSM 116169 TaxID=3242727 RepID=UPI0038FC6565
MEKKIKEMHLHFQSIDKTYEKYAKSVNLNYIELAVLEFIYHEEDICTQKKISNISPFSKQSINVAIKFFLKEEIIELKEIEEDRRNKKIVLTNYGQKYASKIIGKIITAEENILRSFSNEEQELIIKFMNQYDETFFKSLLDD